MNKRGSVPAAKRFGPQAVKWNAAVRLLSEGSWPVGLEAGLGLRGSDDLEGGSL